jgi:AraC-like DNA-binding protein
MSQKAKTILYVLLFVAALVVIGIWPDWMRDNALVVVLAALAAIFACLYFDTRRSLKNILSRSAEAQAIPEVLNYDYDFDRAKVQDEADVKLLGDLRALFEDKEIYLDKDLSIKSLAKMAGTTKARMSHFINEVFGCNFPTFLNNYRVTKAVSLFSDPANAIYTVEAIGEKCGFNNRQAFHSSFKKRIGMPPSKFRELIKKTDL